MPQISKPYPGCEICQIIPNLAPEFTFIDGRYWIANLSNQDQTLLGRSYIGLKRHASELDQLTAEEESEFISIRNRLLHALRTSFSPVTFNVSCLKNDAFKSNPDNTAAEAAHVHWHVIPRYGTKPISVGGDSFTDPSPGRYLATYNRQDQRSKEVILEIAGTIRRNLQ